MFYNSHETPGAVRAHEVNSSVQDLLDKNPDLQARLEKIKGLRGIEWVNFGGGSAKNLCIG